MTSAFYTDFTKGISDLFTFNFPGAYLASTNVPDGFYVSLLLAPSGPQQLSTMSLQLDMETGGEVSFYVNSSSTGASSSGSYIDLKINGVSKFKSTTISQWTKITVSFTAGINTFSWGCYNAISLSYPTAKEFMRITDIKITGTAKSTGFVNIAAKTTAFDGLYKPVHTSLLKVKTLAIDTAYSAGMITLYEDFSTGQIQWLQTDPIGAHTITTFETPPGITHSLNFRPLIKGQVVNTSDRALYKTAYFGKNAKLTFQFFTNAPYSSPYSMLYLSLDGVTKASWWPEYANVWRTATLDIPIGLHTIAITFLPGSTQAAENALLYITDITLANVDGVNLIQEVKAVTQLTEQYIYNPSNTRVINFSTIPSDIVFVGPVTPVVVTDNVPTGYTHAIKLTTTTATESGFYINVNMMQAGVVMFKEYVSSERNYDELYFKINGQIIFENSDTTEVWTERQFPVPAGNIKLEWIYRKDGSDNAGQDAVFVAGIVLTPVVVLDENFEILYQTIKGTNGTVTQEYIPIGYTLTKYSLIQSNPPPLIYDDITNYRVYAEYLGKFNVLKVAKRMRNMTSVRITLNIYCITPGSISYNYYCYDSEYNTEHEFMLNGANPFYDYGDQMWYYVSIPYSAGWNTFEWVFNNWSSWDVTTQELLLTDIQLLGNIEPGFVRQTIKFINICYDSYTDSYTDKVYINNGDAPLQNFVIYGDPNWEHSVPITDLLGYEYALEMPNTPEPPWYYDDEDYYDLYYYAYLSKPGYFSFWLKSDYEAGTWWGRVYLNGSTIYTLDDESYDWQHVAFYLGTGLNIIDIYIERYAAITDGVYRYPEDHESIYITGLELAVDDAICYQNISIIDTQVTDFEQVIFFTNIRAYNGIGLESIKTGTYEAVAKLTAGILVDMYIPEKSFIMDYEGGIPSSVLLDGSGYNIISGASVLPYAKSLSLRIPIYVSSPTSAQYSNMILEVDSFAAGFVSFTITINNGSSSSNNFAFLINGVQKVSTSYSTTSVIVNQPLAIGRNVLNWRVRHGYSNSMSVIISPVIITNVDTTVSYVILKANITEGYNSVWIAKQEQVVLVPTGESYHDFFKGQHQVLIKLATGMKLEDVYEVRRQAIVRVIIYAKVEFNGQSGIPIPTPPSNIAWSKQPLWFRPDSTVPSTNSTHYATNGSNLSVAQRTDGGYWVVVSRYNNVREGMAPDLTTLTSQDNSVTEWNPLDIPNVTWACVSRVEGFLYLCIQINGVYKVCNGEHRIYISYSGNGGDWTLLSNLENVSHSWFTEDDAANPGLDIYNYESIYRDTTGCISRLQNGRLVMPCGQLIAEHWWSNQYIIYQNYALRYSDDEGHTWHVGGRMYAYMIVGDYYEQNGPKHICQTTDGDLWCAIAANQGGMDIKIYRSTDNGTSWTLHHVQQTGTTSLWGDSPVSPWGPEVWYSNFDMISNGKGGIYLYGESWGGRDARIWEIVDPVNNPSAYSFNLMIGFPKAYSWLTSPSIQYLEGAIVITSLHRITILDGTGYNIYVITNIGLKQVIEAYLITPTGLVSIKQMAIIQ